MNGALNHMLRIQYGGTFDPVHQGHLAVARSARDRLQAEVWLMPAADPPHKPPTEADAGQRRAMLQLAVTGQSGLHVDDRELHRDGPSYTIDTLIALRDMGVDYVQGFIISKARSPADILNARSINDLVSSSMVRDLLRNS